MGRRTPKTEVSNRILSVATELFIKNGYAETSVRDIATAANANVAHVKYYFDSKYNLFEIIFEEAFNVMIDRVFETINSDLPFFDMVESWINIYYEILPEYPQIPMFVLNEITHSQEGLIQQVVKRNPETVLIRLEERMQEEIEKGTIKDIPVVDFGLNLLSMCLFPFLFKDLALKIANKSEAEYRELLESHKKYVVDFVFSGLKP